ncbi:MAG: aminopeptidase P family protein [Nitrospina sp.]|nr:aminopeptidase P family protein [Nitrospina sp.]
MIRMDRVRKVQERMKAQNIDAYMILTHDDYTYLFGEDRSQPRAIIPAEGQPLIVTFKAEEKEIKEMMQAHDVRIMSSVGEQIKDVVGVMKTLKGDREHITVGVQMWFSTPAFLLNMFQKANPFIKIANIASVMDELRMVKDNEELEIMKRAGEIADIGMEAAAKALRPGVTENEVAAEAEYAMRKAGGGRTQTPVFVNSGYRSCWLHGGATDKVIAEGEIVLIDLVPTYKGYCSNLCRTFVVGTPTAKQQELFDLYLKVQGTGIHSLKPGNKMRDIDAQTRKVIEDAGFGEYYVAGISHSIGLGFEETPAPTIHPADSAIEIREGMTMTVGHTVLAVPEVGGVRIEDTFAIGKDNAVPLTRFPKTFRLPAS